MDKSHSRNNNLQRLERYYHIAKRNAWDPNHLSWGKLPSVPGYHKERWQLIWSSVVEQQLQADEIAVDLSQKILNQVTEPEAKLFYRSMLEDEIRHVECWNKLHSLLKSTESHNPYLAEAADILLSSDDLLEQVVVFQVAFEGTAMNNFKVISKSAKLSILGKLAKKLIRDDSIHYNSGKVYAEYLLSTASLAHKKQLNLLLKKYAPLYIQSACVQPTVRKWTSSMGKGQGKLFQQNQYIINKALTSLKLEPVFDI